MKELVVISGKGGTGKTSLVACFAALAPDKVMADCDVDAADLHLMLKPTIRKTKAFFGGKLASVVSDRCTNCGLCAEYCVFDSIRTDGPANAEHESTYRIDPVACEGCGVCAWFCPEKAIDFAASHNGEYYVSETRYGPMVHAKLGIAEENSGKLVSTVRARAREEAEAAGCGLVIVDGAPGVGCPVIASVTNVDLAVIVTEPTLSGRHDLGRVLELLKHFDLPAAVLINKFDINPEVSGDIEKECADAGVPVVGRIAYTKEVVAAQLAGTSYVEYANGEIADEIRAAWQRIDAILNS